MNYIWIALILISFIFGAINGTLQNVVNSMLQSTQDAVKVAFSLIGIMAFWLGIMKIAQKSGLVEILSKIFNPFFKLIFKDLKKDSPAYGNIALNFCANALGLANAATPFGIKAMQGMQNDNPEPKSATNSMCTFLAMNTAGFQLIPATVLAILVAYGAKNPTEIILPTLIVTTSAFFGAIIISKILERVFK